MSDTNVTTANTTKKLVPQLRFPEFTGEWERKKLGDLGTFKGGGTPSKTNLNYWNGDIPWISSSDISEGNIFDINISRYITDRAVANSATKIISKGSILFVSRVGVGKLAINETALCTSQDFTNLKLKKDYCYFLGYLFSSKKGLLINYSQGTSIKGFTINDIKSLKINLPQLPEQQKIANFLSLVDKKISLLQEQHAALNTYKKGLLQQLFSQQLRFKDSQGNSFPDWEEKRLGEVCKIVGGGTPSTAREDFWNGTIQWFTPTEIKQKYVDNSVRTITELGLKNSSAKLLPKGTILLTTRATIGEVSISTKECSTNQGFQSLIVNDYVNNIFIYNWIKKNKHQLLKRANGSTFSEISKGEIQKLKVKLPCLEEQTKIATFLSKVDERINMVQQHILKTQELKKGLLQQLFV